MAEDKQPIDWSNINRYSGAKFDQLYGNKDTVVNPVDRRPGIETNIFGKRTDGEWHKIAETQVDGYKVDVISKDGISRYYMFPDGTTVRYDNKLGAKKKVAEMRETEARNEAQAEADRIKEQREQAEEEIKAEKEYQQGKREEYEKEQQKYADILNSVWGEGGQPTINGFAQSALDAANAYAEKKAREQAQNSAQMQTHAAKQNAMQTAMNAGMSPAQAAAMAGGSATTTYNNAYENQYNNTFQNQQQSYLGKQTEGIGVAQQQQNRADQNYNTATQNIYQQNNRQDDYLGVAQQERDYYNNLSQQELQKQLQYYQQQLNAAQTAINTITGLIQTGASFF